MVNIGAFPKASGIYCIKNKRSCKCYVGKAVNLNKRVKQHLRSLRSGNHHNPHLQRAWNIDGEDSFEFSIMELCDKAVLDIREIALIEKSDSFRNGYNMTAGGEGALGRQTSESTKMLIRSKQPNWHGSNSPKAKSIVLLNTGEIFGCLSQAAEKYHIAPSDISSCCTGKLKSAGSYNSMRLTWMYLEEYNKMSSEDIVMKIEIAATAKARGNASRARKIVLVNNGEVFDCVTDATKKYAVNITGVCECCKGKIKYSGKHNGEKLIWKFYEDYINEMGVAS